MKNFDKLLEKINEEFKLEGVPHIQRSFLAMSKLSKKLGISIQFGSQESDYVSDWFARRSKASALCVGSLFEAAYYYDAEFWTVKIPIIFGVVQAEAYDALDMPKVNVELISKNDNKSRSYALFWADCMDFSYGISDLQSSHDDSFGIQLLGAGFEELRSATSALLAQKVNKRAIMNARMALEMFMKSYLAMKGNIDEKGARNLGHDLHKALKKVSQVSGKSFPKDVYDSLELYPSINERYSEQKVSTQEIASCYNFALSMGAFVTRTVTDRNILSQVLGG
ncbi:hypothetical protein [Pseudoalteromonas maricaloris]|uniref:HEPN domain-containing protein n=1 Tax=Pseudoalteromonas maricaloris TaxID=184924 RepID=A0A8I2H7A3_9GAMM|nr:hypothetical protein [Pseudoalteromonas maricaloris]NLR23357.1 hypothetical protein [Pseudoalteromonas maricaloris]WOX29262.1 hypothetical protein R5H13_03025 [Pseudoalteromonas maricaloris]